MAVLLGNFEGNIGNFCTRYSPSCRANPDHLFIITSRPSVIVTPKGCTGMAKKDCLPSLMLRIADRKVLDRIVAGILTRPKNDSIPREVVLRLQFRRVASRNRCCCGPLDDNIRQYIVTNGILPDSKHDTVASSEARGVDIVDGAPLGIRKV